MSNQPPSGRRARQAAAQATWLALAASLFLHLVAAAAFLRIGRHVSEPAVALLPVAVVMTTPAARSRPYGTEAAPSADDPAPPQPADPATEPPPQPAPEPAAQLRPAPPPAAKSHAERRPVARPHAAAPVAAVDPGPPAPPAAAPGPDISPDWRQALSAWLQGHRRYPEAARSHGDEGRVAVRFTVDRAGRVQDAALAQSSGSAILDAAALAMLTNAVVPAFPPDMTQDRITVSVQIRYALQN